MVSFPPGEVLPWDFFRGKVCYMVFLHGERLPYGIISGGTMCHGICSLIMKFVWGKLYHMVLFPPWGSSAMGFLPGVRIPSAGTFAIGYNFRGKFSRGEEFPCDTCHRRPFLMHENHFLSHFSPFHINIQLLFLFFHTKKITFYLPIFICY